MTEFDYEHALAAETEARMLRGHAAEKSGREKKGLIDGLLGRG